jgi:hypothetical protein
MERQAPQTGSLDSLSLLLWASSHALLIVSVQGKTACRRCGKCCLQTFSIQMLLLASEGDVVELTTRHCGPCETRRWQSGNDTGRGNPASPLLSVTSSKQSLAIMLATIQAEDSPLMPLQAAVNWISLINALWEEVGGRAAAAVAWRSCITTVVSIGLKAVVAHCAGRDGSGRPTNGASPGRQIYGHVVQRSLSKEGGVRPVKVDGAVDWRFCIPASFSVVLKLIVGRP